ncbi:hypothetical protein C8R45DRAFT_836560 [Mycena sanguinolenta]|nr:hypothetical protein C8R45DRAFT_836560 [Mycena sanguinolenta]
MSLNPGILLMEGTQRFFNKIILSLHEKPYRKSTETNLERVQCSVDEQFDFQPTNAAIWSSIRATHIPRLTRNFLWNCMHNTYQVGSFWEQVPNLEIFARCSACRAPESMG